jgi:hypothetical protein
MYYSYDINNVHIVSLNSEVLFEDPTDFNKQYMDRYLLWLKADLDRSDKPWKIVYMHRPVYCSKVKGDDCNGQSEQLRLLLENILIEAEVDLVITAHRHNYER